MQKSDSASLKYVHTPLRAPFVALKGVELKDDVVLADLKLSSSDHLIFLYPVRESMR